MTNATAALRDHETLDTALTPTTEYAAERARMTAVVATGYGPTDVLEFTELPIPTPKDGEMRIRVHAANVGAADSMMRRGDPAFARLFLGVMKPKSAVPGTGLAGVVEAVGAKVTRFQVGDVVYGLTGVHFGAHAEYVCVPEDGVIRHKPKGLSFEDAATMCDGPTTSWNFLKRMAQVEPGQKVLINGASGALGTAAVQIASSLGAEVTGVCSGANAELVRSLGADEVIDYTEADFTENLGRYDVIYDTVGKSSYGRSKRALAEDGVYLSPVLSVPLLFQSLWTSVFGAKKARFDATGMRPADELRAFLVELEEMVEAGTLRTVLERVYPLDEIREAHAHVDSGHKKGTVVVQMPAGA